MKGDTISRSAAVKQILEEAAFMIRHDNGEDYKTGIGAGFKKAADMLENAPAVDAAPVVHARWIEEFDENGVSWGMYYCSNCHGGPGNDSDGKPWLSANCPNCGARMDAEEGAGE